ncbi:flagellin lysine-N-methylase [Selenomonas ruminantium]|uniref:flagellin lysine-N-methylase n=1 Tax=Selenomonas ruminantium TaxID=971 RepID=UPI001567FFAD|nr:flagellin lysine-N-methylase [Selenomonas ruminantium]
MGRNFICYEPEYVGKFKCEGDKCGALCCKDWEVTIDKETYQKYKLIQQRKLRKKIIDEIEMKTSSGDYRIKMHENRCPFLCYDYRCAIQKELGEAMLSEVCTQYPRRYFKISENMLFRVLSITCPIARKLALLKPDSMRIKKRTILLNKSISLYKKIDESIPQDIILSIMMTGVNILQNRNYSLDERLFMLAMYIDKCDENMHNDVKPDAWEKTSNIYVNNNVYFWKNEFKNIPFLYQQYFSFIFGLLDVFYEKVVLNLNGRGQEFFTYVEKSFRLDNKENSKNTQELLNIFINIYNDYAQYVLSDKWYVIENYLVQQFWGEIVPFSNKEKSMENSFIMFLVYYKLMEFFLISMVGVKGSKLAVDDILELLGTISYYVTHVEGFEAIIYEYIEKELDNPVKMMEKLLIV